MFFLFLNVFQSFLSIRTLTFSLFPAQRFFVIPVKRLFVIPGLTGNLILKRCPVKPGMTVCWDEGILDVEHDAIAGA